MSSRYELLTFLDPTVGPIPPNPNRPGVPPRVRFPSADRQGRRLSPRFNALQEALRNSRVAVAETTTTSDPEMVVVFDLAGSVDNFFKAVNRVDGLEFLWSLQEDAVDPDVDFFYEKDAEPTEDQVPRSLYMVMTNARAVEEIVGLFALWRDDQGVRFEHGLAPLKQVFTLLRDVRRWGPEDRIKESGLLAQWQEEVDVVRSQGNARIEIELWPRPDPLARATASHDVREIVARAGGSVLAEASLESIHYHAILAMIPYSNVSKVLRGGPAAIELLTADSVMFVSPSRPMVFDAPEATSVTSTVDLGDLPTHPPRVAILDGVPLENHQLLQGRIQVDDPDNRSSLYQVHQRNHGSSMASLAVHGDLSIPSEPSDAIVHVHPILEPHPMATNCEVVPHDELFVDVIHRAFRRLFVGEDGGQPSAPSVRVVNLSVGDPARSFVRRMSPLARLLDWLAYEYNVVIVVSSGNHAEVVPSVPPSALNDHDTLRREASISLYEQARQRRLLSPAEAINVVTVGALHSDGSAPSEPDGVVDVIDAGHPAPYSAIGLGFRRSVKPDVHLPGGRQLFEMPPAPRGPFQTLERVVSSAFGPGVLSASPGRNGELDAVAYSCGTSNAAVLASRGLGQILRELERLAAGEDAVGFDDAQYHPILARTLLTHAADWGSMSDEIGATLGLSGHRRRRDLTELLGYGAVDPGRVASASRVRAVLVAAGSIACGERHAYQFPLPRSLVATREWRRLTITLGWFSPIAPWSQKYRIARLRFKPPVIPLGLNRAQADHNAVRNGTLQHEVLEGEAAVAFLEGDTLSIDVDCRCDVVGAAVPVRYAVAASLEVGESSTIALYEEVRTALQVRAVARARAHVVSSST